MTHVPSVPGVSHAARIVNGVAQSVRQPRRSGRRLLWFGLRVGVTSVMLVLLLRTVSWGSMLTAVRDAQPVLAVGALGIGMCGILVSTLQWRVLLSGHGIRMRMGHLVRLYLVGMAFSQVLPTSMGGDAIKSIIVGRASANMAGSASAAVLARVTGFVAMLLMAAPFLPATIGMFGLSLEWTFVVAATAATALLLAMWLGFVLLTRYAPAPLRRFRSLQIAARFSAALHAGVMRLREVALSIGIGCAFWVLGCLNYLVYGAALSVSPPPTFYFVAIPLVSLVAFLPVSINGYGVRESIFVYLFGLAHVPAASALLLVLLMDAQMLLFGLVGMGLYVGMHVDKANSTAGVRMEVSGR